MLTFLQKHLRGALGFSLAVTLGSLPLSAQPLPAPTFAEVAVHDPSVIKAGARWYVYGSHGASAWTEDLMRWTQVATSVTAGSPAHFNTFASELSELIGWTNANTLWAADVIQLPDGKFYYYYNVWTNHLNYRSYMGLASANGIEGPFTDLGEIMKGGTNVSGFNPSIHPNTIDPDVFYDRDGQLWMVYGSYSGGIFILRLDQTVGSATFGQPLPGQGWGTKLIGGNHARIEGPCIIYSPESEYYYLFLSYGGLNAADGYNIRLGRSRNPDGPFLDAAGTDLTNVGGADAAIAPHGVKLMGNYQFLHVAGEPQATSRGYLSPGHNSAYYDPDTGKHFLVFHTRFVGRGEQHEVRVHQMFVNSDGWLVVAPHRYAKETAGTITAAEVSGSFKLINHGKAISGTVNTSSVITLHADNTISGAATGTWQLSGAYDATLTLAGTSYRGVFVWQWDDDNKVWVLTFTALSGDGTAAWGSKVASLSALASPTVVRAPRTQNIRSGGDATLTVEASGPALFYQWKKDGADLPGATNPTFTIASATPANTGDYTVAVSNAAGSVTSAAASIAVLTPPPQVVVPNGAPTSRIMNLSTRGVVSTGENVLIAGFVIRGPAAKKLLILTSGMNLHRLFGITGQIGRPQMTVHRHLGDQSEVVAQNSNWQDNAAEIAALIAQVGAQPLSDSSDPANGDAGIVLTLTSGVYSVVATPAAQSATQDGIGIIELFDVTPDDGSRLMNISSRGKIETGARQMILGVVIRGPGRARVLMRGVGPALEDYGVATFLPNPSQNLVHMLPDGTQAILATNDDWWYSPQGDQVASLSPVLGASVFKSNSADSAILTLLDPGVYTSIVSPAGATTGVALAEIFDAYHE